MEPGGRVHPLSFHAARIEPPRLREHHDAAGQAFAVGYPGRTTMSVARLRSYQGPAILSYGFRPFFLLGSVYAAVGMFLWLPIYMGLIASRSAFSAVDWHVHEMLFGYLPAVATGFLLTAIPNWTGRLPVQGRPLLWLVLLWIAGRAAIFLSSSNWLAAAVLDCAFLVAVAATAGIEIVAGRNWRNLKVLVPLSALAAANIWFHVEAHVYGAADYSRRAGIGAAIVLIMVIGGRIIPSFTRNWLVRENPGRLPASFGRFDVVAIAAAVLALASWTALPNNLATFALMALAAAMHLVRLGRWAGERTLRDPLVLILHVGYFFIPLGFGLLAASILWPSLLLPAAGIHALTVGAIGTMTIAVMLRATLGHTGRPLVAGAGSSIALAAIVASALLRVIAAIDFNDLVLIEAAGMAWVIGFGGFVALHGQALLSPRLRA